MASVVVDLYLYLTIMVMIVARKQRIILTLLKLEKMVYRPELLHRNAPDSPGKETPPRSTPTLNFLSTQIVSWECSPYQTRTGGQKKRATPGRLQRRTKSLQIVLVMELTFNKTGDLNSHSGLPFEPARSLRFLRPANLPYELHMRTVVELNFNLQLGIRRIEAITANEQAKG
jgi:hypothetical protein